MFRNLPGGRVVPRPHIDDYGTRLCAGQYSSLAEIDLPDVLRKADHREEDVGLSHDSARILGPLYATIEQRLRLRPCAAMEGHVIAGREQMAAHRRAHHAGPDPADPRCSWYCKFNGHGLRPHRVSIAEYPRVRGREPYSASGVIRSATA